MLSSIVGFSSHQISTRAPSSISREMLTRFEVSTRMDTRLV